MRTSLQKKTSFRLTSQIRDRTLKTSTRHPNYNKSSAGQRLARAGARLVNGLRPERHIIGCPDRTSNL